ncbi:MAG: ROK family protein [Rhodospirillaceae bacterium]
MYIGIDMGGTKVSALVLDRDGRERGRLRRPTPRGYAETLAALAELVTELEAGVGRPGLPVGLGLPGVVEPRAGTVRAVNLPWLAGRPFGADLAEALGRPVPMANDANCFVLSEAVDGAGAGSAVVFGAVLGTGVGGAIAVDGRALAGAHGIAGEWGHTPLPWHQVGDGPALPCPCGRAGCIETILSGAGLVRLCNEHGKKMASAEEIGKAAKEGDESALQALGIYFSALARSLACVINFLDPDTIVLGGGLSDLPDVLEKVTLLWRGLALVPDPRTRLVRAVHGADSGVRGAAWLARQAAAAAGATGDP